MRFVNLTPHEVTLIRDDSTKITVEPSGTICRLETENDPTPQLTLSGIPVHTVPVYTEVSNLPDPENGTVYIVSLLVIQNINYSERQDVVAPDTGPESSVRDENGRIIGVKKLLMPH